MARDEAYRLVQRNAMRSWDDELDFQRLVRDDPDITRTLSDAELTDVFDLDATIAHLDGAFERLRRLAHKEEPVHA
jgi:adenylosuccinate lyase